ESRRVHLPELRRAVDGAPFGLGNQEAAGWARSARQRMIRRTIAPAAMRAVTKIIRRSRRSRRLRPSVGGGGGPGGGGGGGGGGGATAPEARGQGAWLDVAAISQFETGRCVDAASIWRSSTSALCGRFDSSRVSQTSAGCMPVSATDKSSSDPHARV